MKVMLKKNNEEQKKEIKKPRVIFYSLFVIFVIVFFILGIWTERYDARLYFQKSFKEFIEFSSIKIFSNFNNILKICMKKGNNTKVIIIIYYLKNIL